MTAPIPVHPNVNYILADGPEEIRRLSGQYFFQRALFGHEHESAFLPESIGLSKVKRVLDAAAGTAVWVLDLSDKPFASSLELYACDLTTAKFPPEDVLDRARVKAFQQDLTKPFPEDMIASFDLVHIAMIYYAVTEEEWRLVLENVRNILRPGGYLLLQEGDPVAYNLDNPPPPDGVPHDIQKSINGAQPLHALNSIFTGFALKKGFVVGLSYRFQDLLTAQTFSVLSRVRTLACVGSLMQSHQGLAGAELGQYWDQVTPNMSMVVDTLSKVLLRDGDLEAPKGAQIQSEEARKTMITQVQAAIHDGLLVVMSEWVAQK